MTWLREKFDHSSSFFQSASDKILRDKAFHIAKNPKYDGYKKGLASVVYKSFDKKISGSCIKNENISNK